MNRRAVRRRRKSNETCKSIIKIHAKRLGDDGKEEFLVSFHNTFEPVENLGKGFHEFVNSIIPNLMPISSEDVEPEEDNIEIENWGVEKISNVRKNKNGYECIVAWSDTWVQRRIIPKRVLETFELNCKLSTAREEEGIVEASSANPMDNDSAIERPQSDVGPYSNVDGLAESLNTADTETSNSSNLEYPENAKPQLVGTSSEPTVLAIHSEESSPKPKSDSQSFTDNPKQSTSLSTQANSPSDENNPTKDDELLDTGNTETSAINRVISDDGTILTLEELSSDQRKKLIHKSQAIELEIDSELNTSISTNDGQSFTTVHITSPNKSPISHLPEPTHTSPAAQTNSPSDKNNPTASTAVVQKIKFVRKYICEELNCGKKYSERTKLSAHVKTHNRKIKITEKVAKKVQEGIDANKKKKTCGFCSKKFTTNPNLKRHVNLKHSEVTISYDCYICHRKYSRSDRLKRHFKLNH